MKGHFIGIYLHRMVSSYVTITTYPFHGVQLILQSAVFEIWRLLMQGDNQFYAQKLLNGEKMYAD